MINTLKSLFYPFKSNFFVLFFLIIFTAFFDSFSIALLLPLMQNIVEGTSISSLNNILDKFFIFFGLEKSIQNTGLLLISMIVLKNIFFISSRYASTKIVFNIRKHWMLSISENYNFNLYEKIVESKQGVLVNNLVYETLKASNGILKINEMLIGFLMGVSYIVLLLITNYTVSIGAFLLFTFFYFLSSFLGKNKLAEYGKKELELNQQTNAVATESISAMRQIRTFSMENKIKESLDDHLKRLTRISINYEFIKSLPKSIIEVLTLSSIVILLVYFQNNNENTLSSILPIITVFIFAFQRLLGQFNVLISTKYSLEFYSPTFNLIDSLLKQSSKVAYLKRKNKKKILNIESDIVFDSVSFYYKKEKKIIKNSSFRLKKGESTALYGKSGSGKSTVADLLLSLYEPKEGSIIINNQNLNNFDTQSWRGRIGFVSQDNFLFHDTIYNNILISNPKASKEEIINSTKVAQAYDFIINTPQGFNTIVGDRGALISGGQKQRIAIARAMVRDPELLIFDEATSALDQETERKIMSIIKAISKEKTLLIISHKKEIINQSNNILKIENGKIKKTKKIHL